MKCDIELLERAASLVSGTELQPLFERDICRLKSGPSALSKCLVISAPAPTGLDAALNATTKMDSRLSEDAMREAVHQSDVLFWVMSALRMFHGDFYPAVEAARCESVPVWIGLTGVDAVADTEAFIRTAIADAKARLGGDSEIFIFRKETAEQALESIRDTLEVRAQSLAERGSERRYSALRSSMLRQLTNFRRSVETEFAGLEKRLDTASLGLQAAKIQLTSAAASVQDRRSRLISLVDRFAQDTSTRVETAKDPKTLETACKSVEKFLGDFLNQRFLPEAEEAAAQMTTTGANAWKEFQANVDRFLGPVYRTGSGSSEFPEQGAAAESALLKFKSLSESYRAAVCDSMGCFGSMFSGDWWLSALRVLGTPVTKKRTIAGPLAAAESIRHRTEKERALAHLRSAATRATDDLRQVHIEFERRLRALFDEEADAVVASLMNDANSKLDEPTALRMRVLEACKLLESYERSS
jgi:hypothetical protein